MAAEDIVLVIGAYESAFCTDIVASYIFEMTETCFLQAKHLFRNLHRQWVSDLHREMDKTESCTMAELIPNLGQ